MPVKNFTTAGVRERLVAQTAETLSRCGARATIRAKSGNTNNVYLGGALVSSTVYDVRLAPGESFTAGMGETIGNSVDLSTYWGDVDTNANGVEYKLEQI